MAKVSIFIPTINRQSFLREAISSCVSQTYQEIEIIVCDNGAVHSDQNRQVCDEFQDPRVRFLAYEDLLPLDQNWCRIIREGTGEFAKILCDDDVLHPEFIEQGVRALQSLPEAKLFSVGWVKRTEYSPVIWEDSKQGTTLYAPPDSVRILLYLDYLGGGLPTLTLFRLSDLLAMERPFNSDQFYDSPDSGCWLELLKYGGLVKTSRILAFERVHSGQNQASWSADHYEAVFLALKNKAWEGLSDEEKDRLPPPEHLVHAMLLLMKIKGKFPRRFSWSDLGALPEMLRVIRRIKSRGPHQINAFLKQNRYTTFCEVIPNNES